MIYLLIAAIVLIDQLSKYFIIRFVDINETIPVIDRFFSITYVRNTGGAFSFLAERDWGIYFLASMSLIISIVLLVIIYRIRKKGYFWIRLTSAVLAGGSIGNMIDRFAYKSVVDFLMFDFGKYTFPIFNFADMCIVMGSISLAMFLLFDKRIMKNEDEKSEAVSGIIEDTVGDKSDGDIFSAGTDQ